MNPLDLFAEKVKTTPCPCDDGDYCQSCREYLIRDNAGHTKTIDCSDAGCGRCDSTGTVLNVSDPLFDALWERCPCKSRASISGHFFHRPSETDCEGTGYVRRSRAESAEKLLEAVHASGYAYQMYRSPKDEYAWAVVSVPSPSHKDFTYEESADNWLDALAAAILKAREEMP